MITQLALTIGRRPLLSGQPLAFAHWAICWVLVPTIPVILLWIFGGPPRLAEIMLTGAVGLIVNHMSWAAKVSAFLGVFVYRLLTLISGLFNLSPEMTLTALKYLANLDLRESPEYLLFAAANFLAIALGLIALRAKVGRLSWKWILNGLLLVFLIAFADLWFALSARGSYKQLPPTNAVFSSAVDQSGLRGLAVSGHNVVLIVVESMGRPVDPALHERFRASWARPELAGRFDIRFGNTPYYGSTTNAEMRELCGLSGDFRMITGPAADCLPARFNRHGYITTALHSFDGSMFDRAHWYPLVGFQNMLFRDDLIARGASPCRGVFPGACDRDVPAVIGKMLRRNREPQFIYWLTVNSHVPVTNDASLGARDCVQLGLDGQTTPVCKMFSIWDDVAAALARELAKPGLPPTDVLVVGDHMPPFFDRASRLKFDRARVPWILFKYRTPAKPLRSSGSSVAARKQQPV